MLSTPADNPNEAETTVASTTTLSDVHPDIIQTHILTRLAGPALASAATTCSQLHKLASQEPLWAKTCHSTWPSTLSPRVRYVIDTFPEGHRSFFADSFSSSHVSKILPRNLHSRELISAVDLFHGERLILSKVVETETVSRWFRCSPFRIDVVDPKDAVRTGVTYPVDEATCRELEEKLRLTWVVIDPAARRAVDVSSGRAVEVEKHWLSGEVVVKFATRVGEAALCEVSVRWGREMQIREVSVQMEDVDGIQMNGRESLVILEGALRGLRKKKKEGGEGFREFLKRKIERKEGKVRAEGILDMLCVGFVVLAILSSSLFVFWRWNL